MTPGLTVASPWFETLHELVGRDRDLATVRERLAAARLLTLTGPGGVGKTSLASALAARAGAPLVDLHAIQDAELAVREIAHVVAADMDRAPSIENAIADAFPQHEGLLVLDNVEQIDGLAVRLGAILLAAPGLRILATSRRPIGLKGEVIHPLRPLDVPTADTPAAVVESSAGVLFLRLCRDAGSDLRLDEESAAAIAGLILRLDGLPLAMELAAARTLMYSPAAISRHIEADPDRFLERPSGGRHASFGAVLDWSIDLLAPADRRSLLELAVIPSSFDLALAAAVTDRDPVPLLEELMSGGLVAARPGPDGEPRFVILETIRGVARTRLDDADRDLALRRLTHAIVALLLAHGMRDMLTVTSTIRPLMDAVDAIRLALLWAIDHDVDAGLEIALRCGDMWHARGSLPEGIGWLRTLLETGRGRPDLRLRARATESALLWSDWDAVAAEPLASTVAADAAAAGDALAEAVARTITARILGERGLLDQVDAEVARIRELADATGDPIARLRLLRLEAGLALSRDDLAAAVELYEGFADAAAALAFPALEALARTNAVDALVTLGRNAEARRESERAIKLYEESGPWAGIGWPLAQFALAAARLGDESSARDALARAIDDALSQENRLVVDASMAATLAYFVAFGDPALGCRAFGVAVRSARDEGAAVAANMERVAAPDLAVARAAIGAVNVGASVAAGEGADRHGMLVQVAEALQTGRRDQTAMAPRIRLRHGDLSRREVEVLRQLAAGRSDPEIATALFISPKTASVHVSNIKAKLAAESRVETVIRARELLGVEARGRGRSDRLDPPS